MKGFPSELSSRKTPLMVAVLWEDVTVTTGQLRAQVPSSSFPGSSQDGLGASGPGSHDEEIQKLPKVRLATLKGAPWPEGRLSLTLHFVIIPQTWNRFNFEGRRFFSVRCCLKADKMPCKGLPHLYGSQSVFSSDFRWRHLLGDEGSWEGLFPWQ